MTRRLVSTKEAAEALGVAPATIWDWRRQGLVEPARRNRWDLRALRAAQRAPKPYRAERPSRVQETRTEDRENPCQREG